MTVYLAGTEGQDEKKHLYGKRCKDVAKLRQFNFNQWVRFQEYAETHL